MAIKIHNTKDLTNDGDGVKVLVYGDPGAGKTVLASTLPKPIILSAESGLLSLRKASVDYIIIESVKDLSEAYQAVVNSNYQSIALDSISEIAEQVLSAELKKTTHGMQAYGEMQQQMYSLIRSFRDIKGKNVYFSAKMEKTKDQDGRVMYAPLLPGNKLAQNTPYFFDEVLALRVETDQKGKQHRALLCQPDGLWIAKDRSGCLDKWEQPNLTEVFKKIMEG